MKKIPTLTDKEKIDFIVNLKTTQSLNKVKGNCDFLYIIPLAQLLASLFCGGLLLFSGNPVWLSLLAPVVVSTPVCGILYLMDLSYLIPRLKEFKKLSGGKITYKQYKKLAKSGEIAKWEEQFKEQIDHQINEINGIQIEEYKRDAEKQIVHNVYNSLQNTENVELDADKIAEEVKKLINEKNERNR